MSLREAAKTFVRACPRPRISSHRVIAHRRKGRGRVKSKYDKMFGTKGKWALLCGQWVTQDMNVTTNDRKVTCMKCLRRMQ